MNAFNVWFENYYARYFSQTNFRFGSFLSALTALFSISNDDRVLIETGTQRGLDDIGSGESTRIFSQFCWCLGGTLFTIDNNSDNLFISKQATIDFAPSVNYICEDSVQFLKGFDGLVTLLYLDSLDSINSGFQEHNFSELQAIYDNMAAMSVIIIDDYDYGEGKGKLSRDFLIDNGWTLIYVHQQEVFLRL